jgi:flagellum-specific peptidoglycan hydrolase FlgJ
MRPATVTTVDVESGWQALAMLHEAVRQDDPRELVEYRTAFRRKPEEIQGFVQDRVRYIQGDVQRWATPERTLTGGYGDCGNSSRAIIALARLNGYSARLRSFTKVWTAEPGILGRKFVAPAHVAAQIGDPRTGRWEWAEAAIPAGYGEHPLDAARRLGIMTTLKETPPGDEVLVPVGPDDDTAPAPKVLAPKIGDLSDSQPDTPQQVSATKTPVSVQDMYTALSQAWFATFGSAPSQASILVLLAQWGLETANGASMIQYNVGNFKHVPGDGWNWTTFGTTECTDNGENCTPQSASFAAYPDLQTGVNVYFKAMQTRFASAWPAVVAGDTDAFAQLLHDAGYYTASESSYAQGLQSRYNQFLAMDLGEPALSTAALPAATLFLGLVAAGGYYATLRGWLPAGWYEPLLHPIRGFSRLV